MTGPDDNNKTKLKKSSKKRVKECIKEVQNWLQEQPHLPQNIEQNLILSFVVGCKFNMETIKRRLDAYYTVRHVYKGFYSVRDPLDVNFTNIGKFMYFFRVRSCAIDGCDVFFIGFMPELYGRSKGEIDVKTNEEIKSVPKLKEVIPLLYKKILMTCDVMFKEDLNIDETAEGSDSSDDNNEEGGSDTDEEKNCKRNWLNTRCSVYYAIDTCGVALSQIFAVPPILTAQVAKCVLDVSPIRVKGIIVYNAPYLVGLGVKKIMLPLLSKKIAQRIHTYSCPGSECLPTFLKTDLIPNDYGGRNPSIAKMDAKHTEELIQHRDWFLNEGSVSADESKRPKSQNKGMCTVS